jgi:hypothetical protein
MAMAFCQSALWEHHLAARPTRPHLALATTRGRTAGPVEQTAPA